MLRKHYSDALTVEQRLAYLDKAKKDLKGVDFDTLVITGRSGLLMGVTIANAMDKHILIVPKDGETSHSWGIVGKAGTKFLMLDDFISMGTTMQRMYKETNSCMHLNGQEFTWIGMYLYRDLLSSSAGFFSSRTKRWKATITK